MAEYTIFDLMDDIERANMRQEAERRIAQMEEAEKFFLLGLLRYEETHGGMAGIERVIRWIATRDAA